MSAIISAISLPSNRGAATGGILAIPSDGKEPFSGLWYQPLYVDEKDGILKCTVRLPEEKARLRARRNPLTPAARSRGRSPPIGVAPPDRRLLVGATSCAYARPGLPNVEHRDVRLKPFDRRSPVEVGPEIDEQRAWDRISAALPRPALCPLETTAVQKRSCGVMDCTIRIRTLARSNSAGKPDPVALRFR